MILSGSPPGTFRSWEEDSKSRLCCSRAVMFCPTVFFMQEKSIIFPVPFSTAPERVPRWNAVSENRLSRSRSFGSLLPKKLWVEVLSGKSAFWSVSSKGRSRRTAVPSPSFSSDSPASSRACLRPMASKVWWKSSVM